LASSSKIYTRRNPDPDPHIPIEDPEKILKSRKQTNHPKTPILQRCISLSPELVKTMDGIKFDLKFEQSLFISKSDLDLSGVVMDIPGLNTFIPKDFTWFSKKVGCIFWDSLLEEVKGRLEYFDKHKGFSPLNFLLQKELEDLSKDNQSFSSVNSSKGPNQHTPTIMANKYAPLALPTSLNPMPDNYNQIIK
jgi:hypothetical protein